MQVEWYSLIPGVEPPQASNQPPPQHQEENRKIAAGTGRREEKGEIEKNIGFGKAYAVLLCCLPILCTSPAS
jgi:hypothetical protein